MHSNSRTLIAAVCWLALSLPTVAQYGSGTFHYSYVDISDHILHAWVNGNTYSYFNDISVAATCPGTGFLPGNHALTGFADGVGDHIFYLGQSGHLYQLFYCAQNCVPLKTWICQDMHSSSPNAPLPEPDSELASFVNGTQEHLIYTGSNQHVYQLVTANGNWTYQDLIQVTGGPVAASGSFLTSFTDSVGQHIFYLGVNGHVYQLYYAYNSDTWADQDLNNAAGGAPAAASGSQLVSFGDAGQDRIVYQGSNQHIYELLTQPGSWLYHDLTQMTGGVLPNPSSPLTAFAAGGYEYVLYIGGTCAQTSPPDLTCPIYELFNSGSGWSSYLIENGSFDAETLAGLAAAGETNLGNYLYYQGTQFEERVSLGPYGAATIDLHFPGSESDENGAVLQFIDP